MLGHLIRSQAQKLRCLRIFHHRRPAYFFTATGDSVQPAGSISLRQSFRPRNTIDFKSVSEPFENVYEILLHCSITVCVICIVWGSFEVLPAAHICEQLAPYSIFALFFIILMCAFALSVMTHFLGVEVASDSSRSVFSASRAEF